MMLRLMKACTPDSCKLNIRIIVIKRPYIQCVNCVEGCMQCGCINGALSLSLCVVTCWAMMQ